MNKRNIKNLSKIEIESFLKENNEPPYRALQVMQWVHNGISDFALMTDLKKELRNLLNDHFKIQSMKIANIHNSLEEENEPSVKFLFRLQDKLEIESVLIPDFRKDRRQRLTLCISSQVGCAMGCKFCATGYMGFTRNLYVGEIVEQVYYGNEWAKKNMNQTITNVVFMGMGEPMLNFERCREAISIFSGKNYDFQIGERHITISTSGIVKGIYDLIKSDCKARLAVSLHTANQSKREEMMPIAKDISLFELKQSLRDYTHKKKREVFFEYLLLAGINDTDQDAKELIRYCSDIPCKINLIEFNEVSESKYKRSNNTETFWKTLRNAGLITTTRRSRGDDIDAACGQLATTSKLNKKYSIRSKK